MSSTENKNTTELTFSSRGKGKKPGVVHIFNQRQFDENINLPERVGTELDVKKLEETFAIFSVKTFVHDDLTVKQIKREIKKISKTNFSANSCIVVVVLTHGLQNNVIAAKDKLYGFNKMILKIQSNETLKSKPKIFLIQACRDEKSNRLYNKYVEPNFKIEPEYLKETCVLNSSTELLPSFRMETMGTPFIQLFCDVLKEYGFSRTIGDIFDLVMISVQRRTNQLPEIKRNTDAKYIFGDYCTDLDENNEKDVNSNIEDLSELELSESDDDSKAPIQQIIESVSEVIGFVKENDQLTINEKAEQFIAKFKSEDVDKWVQICPCGHTPMPENPVEGGTDIDGHPIYIARAIWNYDLLPAKASLERKHAFVAYNGYEHKTRDFEILTGTGFFWVPGSRGSVPSNAVKGGITCDGEILYIGRTAHDTTITPGKIHSSHQCLYIPFDGLEIRFFHYEVLVKSS